MTSMPSSATATSSRLTTRRPRPRRRRSRRRRRRPEPAGRRERWGPPRRSCRTRRRSATGTRRAARRPAQVVDPTGPGEEDQRVAGAGGCAAAPPSRRAGPPVSRSGSPRRAGPGSRGWPGRRPCAPPASRSATGRSSRNAATTIDAAASQADSKARLPRRPASGWAASAVVEQHHQARQAGVHVLAHHQLTDPGRGAPVHVAQLVADHVLAQRVERDRCRAAPGRPGRPGCAPARPAPRVSGCTRGCTQTWRGPAVARGPAPPARAGRGGSTRSGPTSTTPRRAVGTGVADRRCPGRGAGAAAAPAPCRRPAPVRRREQAWPPRSRLALPTVSVTGSARRASPGPGRPARSTVSRGRQATTRRRSRRTAATAAAPSDGQLRIAERGTRRRAAATAATSSPTPGR